jgi:hypothetical protein
MTVTRLPFLDITRLRRIRKPGEAVLVASSAATTALRTLS